MAMPATTHHWTAAELAALPEDGKRYEIIDGALLVTPAPLPVHQRMVTRLVLRLGPYVDATRIGELFVAPGDVALAADTVVQPDVFVVPAGAHPLQRWGDAAGLRLAVEVLSPATADVDRTTKRVLYQRARVDEYWIVDAASRTIERWRPGDARPEVLDRELVWHPDPTHPPLRLDVGVLFREALEG